jgi:hypothetical protein
VIFLLISFLESCWYTLCGCVLTFREENYLQQGCKSMSLHRTTGSDQKMIC